jgi:hypothetical protein
MIQIGERALHPETNERLMRVRFRVRSNEIGPDGVINWRPEGEGLYQETIMRFVRQRMQQMERWPTKA